MVDQATGAVSRQNGERGTARGSGAPVCPPAVWVKRTRSPWTSGGGALSGRATPAKVTPRVRSRKVVDPSRSPPDIPWPVICPSSTSIQTWSWLARRIASAASSAATSGRSSGGGWS